MIHEIIDSIATQLVTNNDWLSEIRTVGYLNTIDGETTVTDFIREIGLTDAEGNSGYIRFASDQNFSIEERDNQMAGCSPSIRVSYAMTLVIVAKTDLPANLALFTALHLRELVFTGELKQYSTKVVSRSGGSNTVAITKRESGANQLSNEQRAFSIDFVIRFDWNKKCSEIPLGMPCIECTNTLNFGCFNHCDEVPTGINSTYTGTATLKTMFNGYSVTQSIAVTDGEEIIIPLSSLNENYEFKIQLLNEDYEPITKTVDTIVYDCFTIKINP